MPTKIKSVLFVCLANICRSPALMATLRHMATQKKLDLYVDSCGIGWAHLGERSDPRTFEAAKKTGILIDHRAQQFDEAFYDAYDLILTVNQDVSDQLIHRNPKYKDKIKLATEYSPLYKGQPIPDPYYMNDSGFDEVMKIIIDCCEGLIKHLMRK